MNGQGKVHGMCMADPGLQTVFLLSSSDLLIHEGTVTMFWPALHATRIHCQVQWERYQGNQTSRDGNQVTHTIQHGQSGRSHCDDALPALHASTQQTCNIKQLPLPQHHMHLAHHISVPLQLYMHTSGPGYKAWHFPCMAAGTAMHKSN